MASASKPIVLYGWPTPNARKVTTFLEELKVAYGLDYDIEGIDIGKNVQKQPAFLKINPNGRVPAIVDRARNNFNVFESAAILLYLQQHYDKENKFGFDPKADPDEYSILLQWIFFVHGGLGPIQGQANHFNKYAPEKIPYAINRYIEETKRVYSVLDTRLTERDWLAGPGRGIFTIADANAIPWVRGHAFAGIETLDEWPNVKAWVARAEARPAFKAGLDVAYSK
ncbi:unnamed protein product [Somion occarium]|uniref:Glutathione S-transferase n=1 Tax=Somion occarium TaxID=3059160 RepID=A0ABP1D3G0_9APHY